MKTIILETVACLLMAIAIISCLSVLNEFIGGQL